MGAPDLIDEGFDIVAAARELVPIVREWPATAAASSVIELSMIPGTICRSRYASRAPLRNGAPCKDQDWPAPLCVRRCGVSRWRPTPLHSAGVCSSGL